MITQTIDSYFSISLDHEHDPICGFFCRMKEIVRKKITYLQRNQIEKIRISVNCMAFNSEEGRQWNDWMLSTLANKFELELCFDTYSPPLFLRTSNQHFTLSELVEYCINKYGDYFDRIEFFRDPKDKFIPITSETNIFSDELVFAVSWAVFMKKSVTLAGIQAGDFEWLMLLVSSGFMHKIDAIRLDNSKDQWSANTSYLREAISDILLEKKLHTRLLPDQTYIGHESA